MKKLFLMLVMTVVLILSGCRGTDPHWSYKACLMDIADQIEQIEFDYTVEEIEHNEDVRGDDEIHCFDISITYNGITERYCCFAVLDDGEVLYVDCDIWEN